MPAVVGGGVDVAGGVNVRFGGGFGGGADERGGGGLAQEQLDRGARQHGTVARAQEDQAHGLAAAMLVERHHGGRARQWERAVLPRHLPVAEAAVGEHGRQLDLDQQLVGLERSSVEARKEIIGRDPPLASLTRDAHLRGQRHGRSGPVRGGVGVGHAPAKGAAVADLLVRDVGRDLAEQRRAGGHQRVELDGAVPRHRADRQAPVRLRPDESQVGDAVQIHQHRRLCQPEVHGWDQALPTRQHLRIEAVLRQQRQRLSGTRWNVVLKGSWFHGMRFLLILDIRYWVLGIGYSTIAPQYLISNT